MDTAGFLWRVRSLARNKGGGGRGRLNKGPGFLVGSAGGGGGGEDLVSLDCRIETGSMEDGRGFCIEFWVNNQGNSCSPSSSSFGSSSSYS